MTWAGRMIEIERHRLGSFIYLGLVAITGLLVLPSNVLAHPVPAARAILDLQSSGRCELRIKCDVSALVMQAQPGHLGKAADELKALDAVELQARIDDAQQAVEYYLELKFDGLRQESLVVRMPSLEAIRGGAVHGGEEDWSEVLVRATSPNDARTCEITFPAAMGKVNFRLAKQGKTLLRRNLAAGEASGVLQLKAVPAPEHVSLANWIGWIMVALLLLCLVWLYVGRPKPNTQTYSRNTSTGQ